ncbi:MAG: hypothetical protein NC113_02530 [Bacteroides sp.]|nr:hypothetical protein [Muribaculum sp.]MCM1447087.1 hypothetical protein [Bacteroides sp.]
MKYTAILSILMILICSCSGNKGNDNTLTAHNTVERVREEWSRVEKPLSITVIDRDKDELEAMGSIGVFLSDNPEETVREFRFDGETFRPVNAVNVDSTVIPVVIYPYRPGIHPNDSIDADSEIGVAYIGIYSSTSQTSDNINVKMKLKEITALLRLKIKSDSITDVLEGIDVNCEKGIAASHFRPFNGEWIETRATRSLRTVLTGCMVNNGRHHDFNMIPTEEAGEITIGVKVNGHYLSVGTIIPPMRAGSITELRLTISSGKLNIGSSWVDTRHSFTKPASKVNADVQPLQYLRTDGTITVNYDDKCEAIVIDTDGKHGKAVALADVPVGMMFKGSDFSTGIAFQTVDGQFGEGCFTPGTMQGCEGENKVAFNPNVRYSSKCALAHRNGGVLTSILIANCNLDVLEIFTIEAKLGTAYIPTVFELACLSFFLEKNKDTLPAEFLMPEGFYTTCCESGSNTFYSVDIINQKISAHNSKLYPNTNLRLFYLF